MVPAQRFVLQDFLPRTLCKELLFIQNSCAAVGYRPHVRATMLSHLIATNCGALIMPFVTIRETIRELVEAQFGCEFQLFVEFTGLISTAGPKVPA